LISAVNPVKTELLASHSRTAQEDFMPRCNLGSCALGLALLAGCLAPTDDSSPADPPADSPAQPPAKEPVPAPPPDLEPPPEPTVPTNVPGDEYDAAHHQVLYADCAAGALMALDLAGGERRVVADTWPWSEPGNECVAGALVAPGGEHVYALVDRATTESSGGASLSCLRRDLVAVETASGKTSYLNNLSTECCEGCTLRAEAGALQLDAAHGRLLHLAQTCPDNEPGCVTRLTSTALSQPSDFVQYQVSSEQAGDARVQAVTFDPADPQAQVLLLLDDGTIDSLYLPTGQRAKVATIQTAWDDDIEIQYTTGVSMDPVNQRMFVAAVALWPGPDALFVVVEMDLDSGEQTLLYDGSPTADGNLIACHPEPSFDSREDRILMVEAIDASGCSGRVFSVDASTGELSLVAGGVAP
jgi:hypothetical protein